MTKREIYPQVIIPATKANNNMSGIYSISLSLIVEQNPQIQIINATIIAGIIPITEQTSVIESKVIVDNSMIIP